MYFIYHFQSKRIEAKVNQTYKLVLEYFQVFEEMEIIAIQYIALQYLYNTFQETEQLGRNIAEKNYIT